MKKIIKTALLLATLSLSGQINAAPLDNESVNAAATNKVVNPPLAQRLAMSRAQHLQWLEHNGEVPMDADQAEWELSKKASWWGKPLDPKKFWKGKVLWLDDVADREAIGHGRRLPPIPFEDPAFARRSTNDFVDGSAGPDSPDQHLFQNDKENAFWDKFVKTHPRSPDEIQRTQSRIAARAIRAGGPGDSELAYARRFGYPEEAFTREPLFWVYVMDQRKEYSRWNQGRPSDKGNLRIFFDRLAVDPKYITETLTDQQLEAANAWKIVYLNRLQRDNTDPSYINAYLKAWNLPTTVLSSGPKR